MLRPRLPLLALSCPALAALLACSVACAQARPEDADATLQLPPPPSAPPDKPAPRLEGALGLNLGYHPEYNGGSRRVFKATPVIFLRWGRYTLTNASGFATRRNDDVVTGLGMDMVSSERARVGLSLRADAGRGESSAAAYAGLGNIRPTVRLRAAGSWRVQGPWRLGASWNADLLGRGGGDYADISGGWELRLAPDTLLNIGSAVTFGTRRYMQAYYGITPAQSARSGHAVYAPAAGVRDASVFASLRHDIGHEWVVLTGASVSRLLGSAAASPLTTARGSGSVSLGAARAF